MNKYDDIKRFKAKTKLEDIDYKEIPSKKSHDFMRGFPILEQLTQEGAPATAGALSPPSLALEEFNQIGMPPQNLSLSALQPSAANFPQQAESQRQYQIAHSNEMMGQHHREAALQQPVFQQQPMQQQPSQQQPFQQPSFQQQSFQQQHIAQQPTQQFSGAPILFEQSQRVVPQEQDHVVMPQASRPLTDSQRFDHLFSQNNSKNKQLSQPHSNTVGRDTPLKSLLELIALCR